MTQKIDNPDLDVIIIGAGPAGGSCARELAKLGKKVLIIERSQEIGEPNYSTAGTPKETVEIFNLPEKVLSASWNRIYFATPRVQVEWKYPEVMGYVFDFAALRKFLAEDAAQNGAEIMVGTSVTDFVEENGKIVGVKYHGVFGDGEARAKVIVDATGHNEFGNYKLKINSTEEGCLAVGMEYLMTGLPPEFQNTVGFFFGSEYAPGGYAWIFPMDQNKSSKVGVCAFASVINNTTLEKIQQHFMGSLPIFKNMEPTEIHAGAAKFDKGIKNHVYKNVLLVGDSARQINPLLGEGVRHSLAAGRLAAKTIFDSLRSGSCDEMFLKNSYEKSWRKVFGEKWRVSSIISNTVGTQSNDAELDEFNEALKTLSPETAFKVFFEYDYWGLLKHPKIISSAIGRRSVYGIVKS